MRTKRPSWDRYFLDLAQVVKDRSNCLRGSVGAVLVQGTHIIATGYNGAPAGVRNCDEGGCSRCKARHENKLKAGERKDLCICIHAEENAVLQAALHGAISRGATLYATIAPCSTCAKSLINAGIVKIVYEDGHSDDFGLRLLKEAGVTVKRV